MVTLPYYFDTSSIVKSILRAVLALLLVVLVPGVLYSLVVTRSLLTVLLLLIVAAMLVYFGRIFHQNLEGSRGIITADAVEVEPETLYGIRLKGPAGRFPVHQFKAVRLERTTANLDASQLVYERVRLIGGDGTPDLLIARIERNSGKSLAEGLAIAIGLPFEEIGAPR